MKDASAQPVDSRPFVTAVIPTCGRPQLVTRAVTSALGQTVTNLEVIVVVDGPDEATTKALEAVQDPRLRVEVLPSHQGVSAARNRAVALARAPWVALLDDDDEWMPDKLELQLERASDSADPCDIIATRFLARFGQRDSLWPRRLPRAGESAAEYIFCRSSLFFGEGSLLTSTLLVRRELLAQVPFPTDMERGEDVDWLVRVTAGRGARVGFVTTPKPLAVWHQLPLTRGRKVRKSAATWRYYLAWLDGLRPLLSARAYSSALLTWMSHSTASLGDTDAFVPLLRAAFRSGRPTPLDVLLYLAVWLHPARVAATLSEWCQALRTRLSG